MSLVRNNRFVFLLVVTAIFVFIAFMVTQQKAANKEQDFGKFVKELQANMDNVGTVIIQHKGQQFKIKKQSETWAMVDKNDYPVAIDKIRDLVAKVADLEIIEKKTDSVEGLPALALEDPKDQKSEAYRIVLLNAGETEIYADFIKGNNRKSGNVSTANAIYVRKNGENQAWLVRGGFEAGLDLDTFLRPNSFRVKGSRIKETVYHGGEGEKGFVLARDSYEKDFKIESPKDAVSADPVGINNLATLLSDSFVILDVRKQDAVVTETAEPAPQDAVGGSKVVFKTFDGL